jgi:hypothetical protein
MAETELTLELRPWWGGGYTRVHLRGTMATVAPPKETRGLLWSSSWWSGALLGAALCVDDGTRSGSSWLEVRDDVLARNRERHLGGIRVSHETLAAQADDDR